MATTDAQRAERRCECQEPPHRLSGCDGEVPDDGIVFCDDCLEGDHSEGQPPQEAGR